MILAELANRVNHVIKDDIQSLFKLFLELGLNASEKPNVVDSLDLVRQRLVR